MTKKNDNLNQAIDALRQMSIPQGPSDELVRQTLSQIEQTQSTLPRAEKRSFFLKNSFKFAAAAMVIISVSLFFLFNSTPNSIALADVYTKVLQSQAFMYQMSMTMSGMGELMTDNYDAGNAQSTATVTVSTEYGMKFENHMQIQKPDGTTQHITQLAYMLPNDNIVVSIMPEQKTYQKIELTDQLLEDAKKQNNDPRELIRRMMACDYVSLGQSEIDGVKVQGFETTDPAYSAGMGEVRAVLWVNVNTWLPVHSEVLTTVGEKMKIEGVISDFQWDVSVDPSEFAYVIPDDYKDAGSMKMPEMTEEAAIEGLQLYSKCFGQYPEKIDIVSLVPSLTKKIMELVDNPKTEYAKELAQKMQEAKDADDQAVMQKSQQIFTPITSLAMFHMKLAQDKKEPVYYGDRVTPQDTDAVLMRWKTDTGTYRVIFGDLSVTEMTDEDLKAIEPQPEPGVPPTDATQP